LAQTRTQYTIEREAELEGAGLFSSEHVTVRFKPAPANTGIVLCRPDIDPNLRIPATIDNVIPAYQRTSFGNGEVQIHTVEHLLGAVGGLGIDNLVVELNADEFPACDGSSASYVRLFKQAGIVSQNAPRRTFVVTEPVMVQEGGAMVAALPSDEDALSIVYQLDYGAANPIPAQTFAITLNRENFVRELATSRTYILESEVDRLRGMGYGKLLTYEDILVFGPEGVIQNTLRFPDEPVRHKVLDLIGDLALLNRDIRGRIVAIRSGHKLNQELVHKLRQNMDRDDSKAVSQTQALMDIRQIQKVLPHRYPMLMVDRIIDIIGDERVVGIKNVTINELFFQGHYPGTPIMPGVLIIEAMAQLAGVLLLRRLEHTGQVAVIINIDKVRLRRPVVPGDQLRLEAEVVKAQARRAHVRCHASVGGEAAGEAELRFMLIDAAS
jgi:UDP-3-O-[3-hydroxymyristoyl] N-acetylglucosamine deacetylase/3-hydroxyacyl-[acyl-carrier-protein] dehydratase